jgi:hypothetical protein
MKLEVIYLKIRINIKYLNKFMVSLIFVSLILDGGVLKYEIIKKNSEKKLK